MAKGKIKLQAYGRQAPTKPTPHKVTGSGEKHGGKRKNLGLRPSVKTADEIPSTTTLALGWKQDGRSGKRGIASQDKILERFGVATKQQGNPCGKNLYWNKRETV